MNNPLDALTLQVMAVARRSQQSTIRALHIGKPQKTIEIIPSSLPQTVPAAPPTPAPSVPVPEKEPVPV